MELEPLDPREGVSVEHRFFSAPLPSLPRSRALVVKFSGCSGVGCANNVDAIYMEAVIASGLIHFSHQALVLDLQEMSYEWGDQMVRPLGAGQGHYVDADLPTAVVVSDLNREGLTSLVRDEMLADPSEWLFDTLEEALARVAEIRRESLE